MKHILIAVLFLAVSIIKAQDTLHFFSQPPQAVKLTEVLPTTIKYYRFGTDAPLYTTNKNEIHYVRFANGGVDTLTFAKDLNKPVIIAKEIKGQMLLSKNGIIYEGRLMNNVDLGYAISMMPAGPNKQKANFELACLVEGKKRNKLNRGLIGLGFGVPAVVSTISFVYLFQGSNSNDRAGLALFTSGVVIGAAIRITAYSSEYRVRNERRASEARIAALFNE